MAKRTVPLLALALFAAWLLAPRGTLHAGETASDVSDLPGIIKRGTIRFIIRQPDGYLPRDGMPLEQDRVLAQAFGDRLNLNVEFVVAPTRADLIPYLLAGKGDVVAASLQITPERSAQVEFSRPLKVVRQQLVVTDAEPVMKTPRISRARRCMSARAAASLPR